jgi:hypothetical protein
MARNFLSRVKILKVKDHSAASTDAVESAIVDTAGYEGVVFRTSLGTANATNYIKVQQSATNATDDMADLTGTKVGSGTTDEDLVVEVYRPTDRYVRLVVNRGASSTCETIWADLYGNGGQISANSVAGTQLAEIHASPSEGTA